MINEFSSSLNQPNEKQTTQEQINQIAAYQVVPKKAWVWLVFIVFLLACLFLWSLFWTLVIDIEGKGIVLAENTDELISSNQVILLYGFFPSESAKNIQIGSLMQMSVAIVNQNESRSMLSRVKEISEYPISEKDLLDKVHNMDLVQFLTNHGLVTQVIAEPIAALNISSKDSTIFPRTSKKEVPINGFLGNVGTVRVTIEKVHPINYLFPTVL